MKPRTATPGRTVAFKAGLVAASVAAATSAMMASHEAAAGPRTIGPSSPAAHVMQTSADYGDERLLDILYQLRSYSRGMDDPRATMESMERDAADMKSAAMHQTSAELLAAMKEPAAPAASAVAARQDGGPADVDGIALNAMESLASLDKTYNNMNRLIGSLAHDSAAPAAETESEGSAPGR